MKNYIIGFMVIALFSISLISFGVEFGQEANSDINIRDDNRVDDIYTGINETIYDYNDGGFYEEANSTLKSFNQEDPEGSGGDGIFFETVKAIGTSIMGIGNTIFNVIWGPILSVIFPNSIEIQRIIGSILSTILLFLVMLLAWKLYRVGY